MRSMSKAIKDRLAESFTSATVPVSPPQQQRRILHLLPLAINSHPFSPKRFIIGAGNGITIGREVQGTDRVVKEDNGIFSCNIMSRRHAKIFWGENGKPMIADTESTHGTYVNDVRLGNSRLSNSARELKKGDVVSFGKDVVREHGKYHKVSAFVWIADSTSGIDVDAMARARIMGNEASSSSADTPAMQPSLPIPIVRLPPRTVFLDQQPVRNADEHKEQDDVSEVVEQEVHAEENGLEANGKEETQTDDAEADAEARREKEKRERVEEQALVEELVHVGSEDDDAAGYVDEDGVRGLSEEGPEAEIEWEPERELAEMEEEAEGLVEMEAELEAGNAELEAEEEADALLEEQEVNVEHEKEVNVEHEKDGQQQDVVMKEVDRSEKNLEGIPLVGKLGDSDLRWTLTPLLNQRVLDCPPVSEGAATGKRKANDEEEDDVEMHVNVADVTVDTNSFLKSSAGVQKPRNEDAMLELEKNIEKRVAKRMRMAMTMATAVGVVIGGVVSVGALAM